MMLIIAILAAFFIYRHTFKSRRVFFGLIIGLALFVETRIVVMILGLIALTDLVVGMVWLAIRGDSHKEAI